MGIEFGALNYVARSSLDFTNREIQNRFGQNTAINRKSLHKFGQNAVVVQAEALVNYGGIDALLSSTNSIDAVSSSAAGDTSQTVTVEGLYLDGSSDLVYHTQDVALNGQTDAALTQALARVVRIANVSSATVTAGDVYVHEGGATTGGIPDNLATVGNVMVANDQTTLYAGMSVEASVYLVVTGFYAFMGQASPSGAIVDVRLKVRDKDSVFRTIQTISISDTNPAQVAFDPYFIVSGNSDLQIVAESSSASDTVVSAGFNAYYADVV